MKHSPAFLRLVDDAKLRIREVMPEEIMARLEHGEKPFLIDTREDREWAESRIPGSVHLGKGIIERDIEAAVPSRETEIILYCGGGYRTALAADNLQKMGYTKVFSLAGGIRRWRELSYPIDSSSHTSDSIR